MTSSDNHAVLDSREYTPMGNGGIASRSDQPVRDAPKEARAALLPACAPGNERRRVWGI